MTATAVLDAPAQLAAGLLVRASTVGPEPAELVETPPPELVTPGTLGFLVTFVTAVVVVLLLRDMVRRNRRIQLRAERRDAELRGEQVLPPAQGRPGARGPGAHGPGAHGVGAGPDEEDPDRR